MSDYPLLTEADEDLGPVIEAVLKAERELPASDPNRFCTLLDAIAQALYDHVVLGLLDGDHRACHVDLLGEVTESAPG